MSLFEPQHPVYAKKLRNRVQLSSYELYPTVVFHWNKNRPGIRELLSPAVWGFPVGPWGVISINMGDQCLLSTTLSLSMGKVNGYTVAEFQRTFSTTEFADEVFRQVQSAYDNHLPNYDEFVLSTTADSGHVHSFAPTPCVTPIENLFLVGYYNEVAQYPANTAESAIETAIHFVRTQYPKDLSIPPRQTRTRRLTTFWYYPLRTARLVVDTLLFLWRAAVG